jgi:Icc-related predicted phosphoesterase
MRILSLSDVPVPYIYSPSVRTRFSGVDLILGCGDLPYYYLEYALTMLNAPLYFVRGNHDKEVEYSVEGVRTGPGGGVDLHRRMIRHGNLLMAGVEGCKKYRPGPYQYTNIEMWLFVFGLAPALLRNRLRYGRYLDLFVTHAPPLGIHDRDDLPHHGIPAFRWLIGVFKPAMHLHGHVHIYRPDTPSETRFGETLVVNAFGHQEVTFAPPPDGKTWSRL